MTVETRGIPLAVFVARAFNIPVVMARRVGQITEGSTVSINYVSGSSKQIQTMALPKRALPSSARVLVIDDFMKAGGTAWNGRTGGRGWCQSCRKSIFHCDAGAGKEND